MTTAIIIGSGPAAAATALALTAAQQQVVVVDIGLRLEEQNEEARDRAASTPPQLWTRADRSLISRQPSAAHGPGLPQKRSFGSDYPFRDVGQLSGVQVAEGMNTALISGAYGGFSNVWGAQVMPFAAEDLTEWPLKKDELAEHYRAVLAEMPFTGVEDDLARVFPLHTDPKPLPRQAPRTKRVLDAYQKRRETLAALGVTVGTARLAVRAPACTPCSSCMTGCPYELIYSARHTFDRLIAQRRVDYRAGLLALRVREDPEGAEVYVRDLRTGVVSTVRGDRVYIACGAVGSTRLMLGSLDVYDQPVELVESVQFVMPAFSQHAVPDPRDTPEFTLNQFTVQVQADGRESGISQVHFYPYNPAMFDALPRLVKSPAGAPAAAAALRRLSVGLGYLPSRFSAKLRARASWAGNNQLPSLAIDGTQMSARTSPMYQEVAGKLVRAARHLDLWPMLPIVRFSGPGKSYHLGGSFALDPAGRRRFGTDLLGRPHGWERVHLVDASVFPSVAATTFTLTIMANAHRIASESLRA